MGEDSEQDAVHGCFVLESAHWPGASSEFAESALDSIGGSHRLALIGGFVAEASEEFIEVVAQAGDSSRVFVFEAVSEATGGGAGGRSIGGIHDVVDGALYRWLIDLFDLVEDVADLVRPAALDRDGGEHRRQGGEQARAAVHTDHVEVLAGEEPRQQWTLRPLPSAQTIGVVLSESCHRHVPTILLNRRRRRHDQHGRPLTSAKQGRNIMRTSSLVGAFIMSLFVASALTPVRAADMTNERALNPQREPQNWILHHGNYQGHRYSLLKEINADTVKNLKPVFTVALSGFQSGGRYAHGNLEATPLVEDGVMYVPDGWGSVYAIERLHRPQGRH